MKFYLYDEKTKQFIKEQEGFLDPLETKAQGKNVYIVPPFSTTEKPNLTSLKDNEILVFKGDKWTVEQEFYVGKIVDCQGERVSKYVTDNDLTFEKCDDGFKIVEKPLPQEKTDAEYDTVLAASARQKRNRLIAATDYLVMPDYPIEPDRLAKVKTYRQALRDVPEQSGFPRTITWPEKP